MVLLVINPELDRLARAPYVSLTTFGADGSPIATPVSVATEGGFLLAVTHSDSGKVERLRRNSNVTLAPCDYRGDLQGDPVPAVATVVEDPELVRRAQNALRAKYRLLSRALAIRNRLRPRPQVVLAFDIDIPAGAAPAG
jgi:uncharacterized protein